MIILKGKRYSSKKDDSGEKKGADLISPTISALGVESSILASRHKEKKAVNKAVQTAKEEFKETLEASKKELKKTIKDPSKLKEIMKKEKQKASKILDEKISQSGNVGKKAKNKALAIGTAATAAGVIAYKKNKGKVDDRLRKWSDEPGAFTNDVKSAEQKVVKFAKDNPQDFAIEAASYGIPAYMLKKGKDTGNKKLLAAGGVLMAVPWGTGTIAAEHAIKEKIKAKKKSDKTDDKKSKNN